MPRILHAADLHLSEADKDYSLAVFSELIATAHREKVDYLLFCGDLFNTFVDAEKLRGDFRRILGTPAFEFLYLPGNHEEIQRGGGELSRLDWGAATVLHPQPFILLRRERGGESIEFLAIPHQENYSGYGNWQVPPKNSPWRIALAHGVVAGMSFRGPDDEGGATAIDPDLFHRFQVDYAALGHIHGRRGQTIGNTRFDYPGSTRVWRRNELGPRGALLLDLPTQASSRSHTGGAFLEPVFIPLPVAGEYRQYILPLSLDGQIPDISRLASTWGPADHIDLQFAGLVEDETFVANQTNALRVQFSKRVRALDIDRDAVSALPGIASQPIVRRFLEAWESRNPELGPLGTNESAALAVWHRARDLALNSLKANLERLA